MHVVCHNSASFAAEDKVEVMVERSRCYLFRDHTTIFIKSFMSMLHRQCRSFLHNISRLHCSAPTHFHFFHNNNKISPDTVVFILHSITNMSIDFHPQSMYRRGFTPDPKDCWFMPIHHTHNRGNLLGDHHWSCKCPAESPGQANSTQPCKHHGHYRKWACGHHENSPWANMAFYCQDCASRLLTLQICIQTWPSSNTMPVIDPDAVNHLIMEFEELYGWYDLVFWLRDYYKNRNLLNPNV